VTGDTVDAARTAPAADGVAPGAEAKARAVWRFVHACVSARRYDVLGDLFTPDFRGHAPAHMSARAIEGPAGMAAYLTVFHTAYPDLAATVDDLVAADDRVAVRLTIRGTHLGGYRGIPPTGATVTFTETFVLRMDGDRIAEAWQEVDTLRAGRQLGIVPPVGGVSRVSLVRWAVRTVAYLGWRSLRTSRRAGRRPAPGGTNAAGADGLPFPGLGTWIGPGREAHWAALAGLDLAALIPGFRVGFPDARAGVDDTLAVGDRLVARVRLTGTHLATYHGLPATGRAVAVTQIVMLRLRGGGIVETQVEVDRMGLLLQLDALPPVGSGAAGLLGWVLRRVVGVPAGSQDARRRG
jgi:predicted ester cyclase